MDNKTIATILRDKLPELKNMVENIAQEKLANWCVLERMRCDMQDVSFYLTDASDDPTSLGSTTIAGPGKKEVESKMRGHFENK